MEKTVLAIDVGGTKTAAGIVSETGRILASSRRPVVTGCPKKLAESLTEQARELLEGTPEAPCAMGVGVKGLVDDRRNYLVSSSILGGVQRDNLREMLEKAIGLPCVIDNDVNAATLAEAAWGAGRETDTFVFVNVGTGTAIGIYDRGRLVRGAENTCGEVCNMLLPLPGEEGLFSLEAVASGKGLADEAARLAPRFPGSALAGSGTRVRAQDVFSAARSGDALAERIVGNAIYALTLAVVQMEAVTGAGLYVFGGGVVSDPLIFDRLRAGVPECCRRYGLRLNTELRISCLGAADAGLLGAARLGFSR